MDRTTKIALYVAGGMLVFLFLAFFIAVQNLDVTNLQQSGTVQIIPVTGTITTQGSSGLFSSQISSGTIADRITDAGQSSSVDAILLEINSPGGAPVASHEIVRAVKDVDKPVAAQIRETGASGAYWVASAADYIVSDPVSVTGSVGVYSSYLEISGLLDDYNVSYQRIVGGEYKDIGSPFKNLTTDERSQLQNKIDLLHDYFLDDVVSSRNLTDEQVERVGTGVFFVGLESIDVGLVDELGGKEEAISYLETETNMTLSERRIRFETGLFSGASSLEVSLDEFDMAADIPNIVLQNE